MTRIKNIITSCLLTLLALPVLTGCDSLIYEQEGNCVYHVRFSYDYNMKWADAFAQEVTSVTLHVIDGDGHCVLSRTESGESLRNQGYQMDIDLEPGTYTFQVWAGDTDLGSFEFGHAEHHSSHTARLVRQVADDGTHHHYQRMDRLYHGILHDVDLSEAYGDEITVPLVKNTNSLRVVLQHLSGASISADDFTYEVVDNNGSLDCYNGLNEPETNITYHPWEVLSGATTLEGDEPDAAAQTTYSAALAEFTLCRLVTDNRRSARLVIRRADTGEPVVQLPLIDALLLVKGHYYRPQDDEARSQYRPLDDQEYLDRQDDYSLTFFLDDNKHWVNTHIYINSWHVVLNNVDL